VEGGDEGAGLEGHFLLDTEGYFVGDGSFAGLHEGEIGLADPDLFGKGFEGDIGA